jgi:hypothetical protein
VSRQYIDMIRSLIEREATEHAKEGKVTLEFITGTLEKIEPKIRLFEQTILEVPPIDKQTFASFFDTASKEYLSTHPIKIDEADSLTRKGFKTWLTAERENKTTWSYTDRYLNYLELKDRPKTVIGETQRSSRDIVGKLGDPQSSSAFFVKGLVVGEVQSGKTANFNAVINRSIDSGYQLIIVLSGIMEDLREQTQDRIELEVVGDGTLTDGGQGAKGVGEIIRFGMQGDDSVQQIESVTSNSSDFSQALLQAGAALNSPKILICKKNVSVLRNLINWLGDLLPGEDDLHSMPLLILDDEADNASLNNEGAKGREYASKTNGHIRAILAMFQRKSYLGYTASPFANVLQDRNDPAVAKWPVMSADGEREFRQVDNLFPDDFIVLLKSPTNYVGAKQIFETIGAIPKLPVVDEVDDNVSEFPTRLRKDDGSPVISIPTNEDWNNLFGPYGAYQDFENHAEYRRNTRASKRDDNFPVSLPRSLRQAILCFILGIAVRESRKPNQRNSKLYQPHNTMLVHVSRFTTWQNTTADLIRDYMSEVKARVENDKPDEHGSIYLEFESVWNTHFADIVANIGDYVAEGYEDGFMTPIVFEAAKKFIPTATEGIDILAINSNTGDKLVYSDKKPKKIIAVGGNRLSRGFTVEGLTINYFVRTTNYSDTLLQMGRWFGYRPGYLDCCRIFTTRESIEKFNSTTRCVEELETEFKKMHDLGKSPSSFVIRVRKHPGVLKITRPSILKNTTTVKWSYQDKLEMTTRFDVSREKIEAVWRAFTSEVAPLFVSAGDDDEQFYKTEITGDAFLDFLRIENNFEETTREAMIAFVGLCQLEKKLTDWTIAVRRTGASRREILPEVSKLPGRTGMVVRNGPSEKHQELRNLFTKERLFRASGKSANIVSSPRDLAVTLTDPEITDAEKQFVDKRIERLMAQGCSRQEAEEQARKTTIPESVYRERVPEHRGVLIIYLCDSRHAFNQVEGEPDKDFDDLVETGGYDLDIPIVGYAIGFPPIEKDPGVIYAHGDYDLDEDEAGDDGTESDDLLVPDDEDTAAP